METVFLKFQSCPVITITSFRIKEIGYINKMVADHNENKKSFVIDLKASALLDTSIQDFTNCFRFFFTPQDLKEKLFQEFRNDSGKLISVMRIAQFLDIESVVELASNVIKATLSSENCFLYDGIAKKLSLTNLRKDINYWITINIMLYAAERKVPDSQMRMIEDDCLIRCLKDQKFVVSDEYQLYSFLKRYMLCDLDKQNLKRLYELSSDREVFMKNEGAKYQELFSCLRIKNLVAFTECTRELYEDCIIPRDAFEKAALGLYSLTVDKTDVFRFAVNITQNELEFTQDFCYMGVALKFKFTTKSISVKRLCFSQVSESTKQLMHFTPAQIIIKFTVHAQDKSEESPELFTVLTPGKEQIVHKWMETLEVCDPGVILAGEVQITKVNMGQEIS